MIYVLETQSKKYKIMNGYRCHSRSPQSFLYHIRCKFSVKQKDGSYINRFTESELQEAMKKGVIRVVAIGE